MACRARSTFRSALLLGTALVLTSCASMRFERTGEQSGTFTSSGTAFTFLSFDLPAPALDIARGNVADSGRANLIVESERVYPNFGRLDWILDILSVRFARVRGTWGHPQTGE